MFIELWKYNLIVINVYLYNFLYLRKDDVERYFLSKELIYEDFVEDFLL